MIIVKSAPDLEGMRASGYIAARVRDAIAGNVQAGVTTGELADYAEEMIKGFGAESAFLGYKGYPSSICVSVNEVVVHGIPGKRRIEVGDIVSIDVGVRYGGYVGDTAKTVMVGTCDPRVAELVKTTEKCLMEAIALAREGRRLFDISHAIQGTAEAAGFSVVRQFVGHGIGRDMHEDPQIPNFGKPGTGPRLVAGMTFAIEPMVNMGRSEVEVLDDGWTVVTKDRKFSAHFEHTVAVGKDGAEVLTL